MKNYLYKLLGLFCVGMAYIGFVTPGIPFSIFLVIAAWAFAKSSPEMEAWLYNHPLFGEFLTNWQQRKVFPLKMKFTMVTVMLSTLIITYFATDNINAVMWSGAFMTLVAVWAWRFPNTVEEYDQRIAAGKKIGWIK